MKSTVYTALIAACALTLAACEKKAKDETPPAPQEQPAPTAPEPAPAPAEPAPAPEPAPTGGEQTESK